MKICGFTNLFRKLPEIKVPAPKGKHIYPRYLYHLTSAENAQRINSEGVLVASNEGLMKESIFLFDLENFLKFWNLRPAKYKGKPIKNALIDRVAQESGDIAVFRIDTDKIDKETLKIRSQDFIFEPERLELFKSIVRARGGIDKLSKCEKDRFAHYFCGDDANKANLYKQRKESIEYVYPFDILRSGFEKIGETTVKKETSNKEQDAFVILNNLFEGKPEQKAVGRFILTR